MRKQGQPTKGLKNLPINGVSTIPPKISIFAINFGVDKSRKFHRAWNSGRVLFNFINCEMKLNLEPK